MARLILKVLAWALVLAAYAGLGLMMVICTAIYA